MLTALLGYSQATYPREIVLDGDTLVAITIEQSKEINASFLDASYYKASNDSLGEKVVLLRAKIDNKDLVIGDLRVQIDNLGQIIINKDLTIEELKEDLKETDGELIKEKNNNKWRKVFLKVSIAANAVLLLIVAASQ